MSILEVLATRVEVYSIDEAFSGSDRRRNPHSAGRVQSAGKRNYWPLDRNSSMCPHRPNQDAGGTGPPQRQGRPVTGCLVDPTTIGRQSKLIALLPVIEVWGISGKLKTPIGKDGH